MITYRCDGCGKELEQHALRYTVEIEVKAAYDKMQVGLLDLVRDHRAEMLRLIERLKHRDPKEIEESVYKRIHLDLCPNCQRAFNKNPLRFHPEQGLPAGEVDIDSFLRSIGVVQGPDEEESPER
ncbi:MAG TPA: hypothetical protein ENN80_15080 [Candidatus Hydrogenedentes bacterium]|nr:hypothetical protein [Candidatus Hydrogenedentota bacterium]